MILKNIVFSSALVSALILVTACSTTTSTSVGEQVAAAPTAPAANTTAADYNTQLGVGYLQQGDVQRAKRKLLLAIDQDPKSSTAQDAMGYYMENTGEPQRAEKYYLKALELNPTSGSTHNNYGTFLCRMKRYAEADKQFMLAVQDVNYVNTAEAYENAGTCAMQVPDAAKATGYFQKAILQDPKRGNSYLQLGQIYFNQGNYQQAKQYLDQYMANISEPGPDALLLGIRLAKAQNDTATAGRYAMTLQTTYPDSAELKQLRILQRKPKTDDGAPAKLSY